MRVACSRCNSSYDVPDEKLRSGGVKVRCSQCGQLFAVRPRSAGAEARPAPPPPPVEEPKPREADLGAPGTAGDLAEEPAGDREPEIPDLGELDLGEFEALGDELDLGGEAEPGEPEPPAEPLEPVSHEELLSHRKGNVQVQGIADDMPRLDIQRGPRRGDAKARSPLVARDRRRSPLFWVVLIAAAGTASWTGYNLYRNPAAFTFLKPSSLRALWQRRQMSARLGIQNLKGYYRELAAGERVFVIRGEVLNKSGGPQSLIRVRGNLFDADGRTVASKEVYCGNDLTDREIETLPRETVDARLQNEVGDALSNVDVAPGARVRFLVVFATPPEGVEKYNVEITAAQAGSGT